jgi:2-polyprenyl-3-methyl-5-hydroxy-6-metoxy-1,4-benzoquinol methylase
VDTAVLLPQLDAYLDGVDIDGVADSVAAALSWDQAVTRNHIATHVAEARVALRVVGPSLSPRARVLEVGSGVGLFAGFLRSIGVDITELEPVGMGFEFIGATRAALAGYARPSSHLDIGVEHLRRDTHGTFDLIFSLNVLEHVEDWRAALERCASVLSNDGQMVHSHPNYSVPFEPHFSVPLVPFCPALTARLLPARIVDTDTWRSLNWITARKVKRWCRSNGFGVRFRRGVLAETLERLTSDPLFKSRHNGLVGRSAVRAAKLGLLKPLKRLPASLNSPVDYSMRRLDSTS